MLEGKLAAIQPLDREAMEKCQWRLDHLTKPLNSLGAFEELACRMAGITGKERPTSLKKTIFLLSDSADAPNQPDALISTFAEHVSARLQIVPVPHNSSDCRPTQQEVEAAAVLGMQSVAAEIESGTSLIGIGELGKSSRFAAAAVVAGYSQKKLAEIIEPGEFAAGELKKLANCSAGKWDQENVCAAIYKAGSLSLAMMTGMILGAAAGRAAVVLDGTPIAAAALLASHLDPAVKDYLIGSHFSVALAQREALALLNLPAYLLLDLNLENGAGAALGMSLIDASLHVLNDMKTFAEAKVSIAQDGPGALKQTELLS